MAAPRFAPSRRGNDPFYESPDVVPDSWSTDRPAEIEGLQPTGPALGYPGPDQGFILKIAQRLRPRICTQSGEHIDDAINGSIGIALRRASLMSRAPVIHDLTIALTIWGWFDTDPPADLVSIRSTVFSGVRNLGHHYGAARNIVDAVPETTLRATPDQISLLYPAQWKVLSGAAAFEGGHA
jgi:hypothetical protein